MCSAVLRGHREGSGKWVYYFKIKKYCCQTWTRNNIVSLLILEELMQRASTIKASKMPVSATPWVMVTKWNDRIFGVHVNKINTEQSDWSPWSCPHKKSVPQPCFQMLSVATGMNLAVGMFKRKSPLQGQSRIGAVAALEETWALSPYSKGMSVFISPQVTSNTKI